MNRGADLAAKPRRLLSCSLTPELEEALDKCDSVQKAGLVDRLIEVDTDDQPIGPISKLRAHVVDQNTGVCPLHRAFSLFLFNKRDHKLLLQRRSLKKITFPDYWTNSCCSHPMHNERELDGVRGARYAVQRRTAFELNLNIDDLDSIKYQFRIHYEAKSVDSDGHEGRFGEHEIDHVFFCEMDLDCFGFNVNEDEVSDTWLVSQQEVEQLLSENKHKFTPWFREIYRAWLCKQWPSLSHPIGEKHNYSCDKIISLKDIALAEGGGDCTEDCGNFLGFLWNLLVFKLKSWIFLPLFILRILR